MKTSPFLRRIMDALTGKPATPAPAKPRKPAQTEPYVYVTKTGKKFHYDQDCPALSSAWSRDQVIKMGLSKARAAGRTACDKCCFGYLHE